MRKNQLIAGKNIMNLPDDLLLKILNKCKISNGTYSKRKKYFILNIYCTNLYFKNIINMKFEYYIMNFKFICSIVDKYKYNIYYIPKYIFIQNNIKFEEIFNILYQYYYSGFNTTIKNTLFNVIWNKDIAYKITKKLCKKYKNLNIIKLYDRESNYSNYKHCEVLFNYNKNNIDLNYIKHNTDLLHILLNIQTQFDKNIENNMLFDNLYIIGDN